MNFLHLARLQLMLEMILLLADLMEVLQFYTGRSLLGLLTFVMCLVCVLLMSCLVFVNVYMPTDGNDDNSYDKYVDM